MVSKDELLESLPHPKPPTLEADTWRWPWVGPRSYRGCHGDGGYRVPPLTTSFVVSMVVAQGLGGPLGDELGGW